MSDSSPTQACAEIWREDKCDRPATCAFRDYRRACCRYGAATARKGVPPSDLLHAAAPTALASSLRHQIAGFRPSMLHSRTQQEDAGRRHFYQRHCYELRRDPRDCIDDDPMVALRWDVAANRYRIRCSQAVSASII